MVNTIGSLIWINYFSDITKEGDIKDALAEIESKFNRLDTAVSCAGIGVAFKTYNFNKDKAHSLDDFTKGTINILRKHFYSSKLNLTSHNFTKTVLFFVKT